MRASGLKRITIVLAALIVSACAGLRPDNDPMALAGSPSAPTLPGLNEGVSFSVNFDAALRQAQDLRKRGEFDSASRVLGQLVIAAPNDARVIGEYGKVMLESGRTDDAAAFLERAVTLNGADWTLFSALGIAYDQGGKAEAARAAFHHALALKPGEPAVLSNLALSHIQAGELDDAERLLLQASEHEKDIPGLADRLAMVRSLKRTTGRSSSLPAPPAERVPDPVPEIQRAPAAPVPPMIEPPPDDSEEQEPATPDDPETETVVLEVPPPAVVTTPPNPVKPEAADRQVHPAGTATIAPSAVRPPPRSASASIPVARPSAPRVSASRAPPVQPTAASEPKAPAATPQPRPAGVARAVTRTATIPLLAVSPPESWELMMRVSLPPPSAAVEKPSAPAAAAPPAASKAAEQPSGWGNTLERWGSAVLGFIRQLWLRTYPETDVGTA